MSITRAYPFVFDPDHPGEGGLTVTCPALPGLVTYGKTMEEARAMAHGAMQGYVSVLIEDGEPMPESYAPSTRSSGL